MAKGTLTSSKEPSDFLPTVWSMIDRAKGGDHGARDQIYHQYRKPVQRFLERRLPAGSDAEALANDVMLTVLDPGFLGQANREEGRFRDLLLAVTRHHRNNYARWLKAKGRDYRRRVSFDDLGSLDPASEEERFDFDRLYADEALRGALDLLRQEAAERNSPEASVLDLTYREGLAQAEVAERLGLTVAGVNTHIDRGRKRLKGHLLAVLALVCRDEKEAQEEVKHLLSILSRRGKPPRRDARS